MRLCYARFCVLTCSCSTRSIAVSPLSFTCPLCLVLGQMIMWDTFLALQVLQTWWSWLPSHFPPACSIEPSALQALMNSDPLVFVPLRKAPSFNYRRQPSVCPVSIPLFLHYISQTCGSERTRVSCAQTRLLRSCGIKLIWLACVLDQRRRYCGHKSRLGDCFTSLPDEPSGAGVLSAGIENVSCFFFLWGKRMLKAL